MKKVAMITGASKGLGRALSIFFAQEGYNLAICARNEAALIEVTKEAEKLGSRVLAVSADVSQEEDVERFIALTEKHFQTIDVLINNAAVNGPTPLPVLLLNHQKHDIEETLRVNTVGAFLVTKRVLPLMLQKGIGSVINLTTDAAANIYPGIGAYSISKIALEGLTKIWAAELEGSGVRVNLVDPGAMDTDMLNAAMPIRDFEVALPEDITKVFGYLASDASRDKNGMRFKAQEFHLVETDRV
ncbi:SDR family NAD(P)-dependent oxidoreductase [Paenibacillus gansuensis]|uniref:SDR family NAD(P)-dependent oxidoreductase n=1 Tax=Paenibacillus gansuensis TaxID=306542 RepID=A0ABW5PK79_9BACL